MWVGPVYFYFIFLESFCPCRVVLSGLHSKIKSFGHIWCKTAERLLVLFFFSLHQNSVLSTSLSDPVRYKPRGVKMIAKSESDLKVNNEASFPLHVTLRNCGRFSFQMINLFV